MNDQPKRRGRPPKAKPQVEAVPDPAETAPESADADRSEGESWEGWQEVADRNVEVVDTWVDQNGVTHPVDPVLAEAFEEAEREREHWEGSPAQIAALDHDHDGNAGGSLPKARLTQNQIAAYLQDASDAYEGFGEIVREDNFHRIWRFRQETVKNHSHMSLSVKRGPMEYGRMVLMSAYRFSDIEALLRDLDEESSQ
jgi:hypothetical protein